jgi:hypothetical protein
VSLFPGNELHVAFAPARLLAARPGLAYANRRIRRCLREPARIDLASAAPGAAPWGPGVAALETLLRERRPGARLSITLSNRFVRYAVVPWEPGIAGPAERAAYARDCLVQLYGDAAAGWDVALAPARRHAPAVASAIDLALVEALRAACARTGASLAALTPRLAAVCNAWRPMLKTRCGWLVLAEPGYLCLALAERRRWRVVRTLGTDERWLDGLAALLEREALLADVEDDIEDVFLWAPELAQDVPAIGPWPVTRLETAGHQQDTAPIGGGWQ